MKLTEKNSAIIAERNAVGGDGKRLMKHGALNYPTLVLTSGATMALRMPYWGGKIVRLEEDPWTIDASIRARKLPNKPKKGAAARR